MTASVTFCVLEQDAGQPAERWACLFAEQCLQAQVPLCIHTADSDKAAELDQLLWTFKDISFIPHRRADDTQDDADHVSITIVWPGCARAAAEGGTLFHLSGLEPMRHEDYVHIIELVPGAPEERRAARARYGRYRELGCALERVEMAGAPVEASIRRALSLDT